MALFAVLITPLMWLGCALVPRSALHVIRWVQGLALATTGLLRWQATSLFTRRVISWRSAGIGVGGVLKEDRNTMCT
jgi:hypothetical protein